MKTCTKCKIEKKLCLFSRDKNSKDRHQHQCKECAKEYAKEHYYLDREKIVEGNKARKLKQKKEDLLLGRARVAKQVKEYFLNKMVID